MIILVLIFYGPSLDTLLIILECWPAFVLIYFAIALFMFFKNLPRPSAVRLLAATEFVLEDDVIALEVNGEELGRLARTEVTSILEDRYGLYLLIGGEADEQVAMRVDPRLENYSELRSLLSLWHPIAKAHLARNYYVSMTLVLVICILLTGILSEVWWYEIIGALTLTGLGLGNIWHVLKSKEPRWYLLISVMPILLGVQKLVAMVLEAIN